MNTLLKIDSLMFYVSNLEESAKSYRNALGSRQVWTHQTQNSLFNSYLRLELTLIWTKDNRITKVTSV